MKKYLLLLFTLSVITSGTALADSCPSANLSTVIGVTCTIGDLEFSFTSLSGNDELGNAWSPNDFLFAPLSNGFVLTALDGPQSITAPDDSDASDIATLHFDLNVLNGRLLTGLDTFGSEISVANTGGLVDGFSQAFGGILHVENPDCATNCLQETEWVEQTNGTVTNHPDDILSIGSPLASGSGYAIPFYLYAEYGASASWDSNASTSFTFELTPVPEPTSLLLLGTGLLGLVGMKWKVRS